MSYSAKIGDINGFDMDIIAMGSQRRAKAESEKKALINSEKYIEPKPRQLSGDMDADDRLKAAAANKIKKMYSSPPARSRNLPNTVAKPQNSVVKQQPEALHTRKMPERRAVEQPKAAPTKETRVQITQPQQPARQRRQKVYTAKRTPTPIQTRKDKNRGPFPIGAVSAIIILTVLFMCLIILFIQSFELQEDISDMKNDLSEKLMTQATWQTKLEEKNPTLDKIEQFATQDGMVRKMPDKYISITPEDDIIERYNKQ